MISKRSFLAALAFAATFVLAERLYHEPAKDAAV
jgi:hypothetical protein